MKSQCKFCADYAYRRHIDKMRIKRFNLGTFEKQYRCVQKASLESISKWKNKNGKWTVGERYVQHGYTLRFCPSCGRTLKNIKPYEEDKS